MVENGIDGSIQVLIIEDDELHLDLIAESLKCDKKIKPSFVRSLREAQNYLKSFKPDIIVADLILPDGKCTQLISKGKKDFPLIVLTGHGSEPLAVNVMKSGAMDYVIKSKETLLNMPRIIRRGMREWNYISENNRLENQLIHFQKMEIVGRIASGVAHDFNNILTAIENYAHVLLPKLGSSEERYSVEQILLTAEKGSHLTQSLLTYSRKQQIHPVPVKLSNVIANSEEIISIIIGKDFKIKKVLSDKDPAVVMDIYSMEQVILNLATNARDSMPDGGVVTISTKVMAIGRTFIHKHGYGRLGKYAVLSVSDSGEGMDEKTKRNIFEPYFTTKEGEKGTGLGMSIVYGIIKRHDGYISVQSRVGKGTTINCYLPLVFLDDSKYKETKEEFVDENKESVRSFLGMVRKVDNFSRQFFKHPDNNSSLQKRSHVNANTK